MEGKPHSSQSYAVAGQLSRMARDLRECAVNFKASYKPRSAGRRRASRPTLQTQQRPRICVVGAGLAGLRCAELLASADIHVTVLEARDRVGGRVSSQLFPAVRPVS